jgi:hypothetical protein
MSPQDYAAIAVAIVTVLGGVTAMLNFMVKHYLMELKPNSGSSMRDAIERLETRLDKVYEILSSKSQ